MGFYRFENGLTVRADAVLYYRRRGNMLSMRLTGGEQVGNNITDEEFAAFDGAMRGVTATTSVTPPAKAWKDAVGAGPDEDSTHPSPPTQVDTVNPDAPWGYKADGTPYKRDPAIYAKKKASEAEGEKKPVRRRRKKVKRRRRSRPPQSLSEATREKLGV